MSSVASEDPKLKELAAIRTQGLMGMVVLFLTLWTIPYHARSADPNVHQNLADAALVGFANAKIDLQNLFESPPFQHNMDILRRQLTFGHDFLPAWMLVILFLYRALMVSRPYLVKPFLLSGLALFSTWMVNYFITLNLDKAAKQPAISEAMFNTMYFHAEVKWIFFFLDALVLGRCLWESPPVVRIGAVILMASSTVGFVCPAIPSGVPVPYCVLALFIGLTGLSVLLLFNPGLFLQPHD